MVNVSRVIRSKRLARPFVIYRKTGSWIAGRWVENELPLQFRGVVTVASPEDILQVPEGDRKIGMMAFYSTEPMFVTGEQEAATKGTSDEAVWRGKRYRLLSVIPEVDYGYYKAIGASIGGA